MSLKTKSAIRLAAVVVLTALLGWLAIAGLRIGNWELKPLASGISQGLDLRGGVSAVYVAVDEEQENFDELFNGTMAVLRNRLVGQGFTEATVTQQGTAGIRVEIPDVKDPNEILSIIGQPAKLEFATEEGEIVMDGSMVKTAEMGYLDGAPLVSFTLNAEGSKVFANATAANIGKPIFILLDGEVISYPTVEGVIPNGEGYISGDFTTEEAQNLAMLIQSGALPLDIEQQEVRTISATLGEDALDTSVKAAIIGVALVMVFMAVAYRLPGVVADLALCIYILIDLFLLAVIPGVQLTLPGIAGIVLSIGMAVDANVIIFERIKEELKNGKTVRASVESGFRRAFTAILDSNITTIIAGAVLMIFGAGSIKGFAITLTIGVAASMFTAIVVTRFLLRQMVGLGVANHALYGVKEGK